MGIKSFQDLAVWQKAKDLAGVIYKMSNGDLRRLDFGLKDQIRRSAVSVASNLAEGDERDTDRESVRYFYMAKGSVAELRTQLKLRMNQAISTKLSMKCLKKNTTLLGKESENSFGLDANPSPLAPRLAPNL